MANDEHDTFEDARARESQDTGLLEREDGRRRDSIKSDIPFNGRRMILPNTTSAYSKAMSIPKVLRGIDFSNVKTVLNHLI